MFRVHEIISCVVIAVVGCDNGSQQGRFAVRSTSSFMLAGSIGDFTVVHGDTIPLAPNSTGGQPLLYLLIVAPGASGGVSSSASTKYISEWELKLVSPRGDYTGTLTWDRKMDQIGFDGAKFDRGKGNAFVLVRDASGKVNVTQLGPISSGLDAAGALQEIRDALPPDSPAKLVTLAKTP